MSETNNNMPEKSEEELAKEITTFDFKKGGSKSVYAQKVEPLIQELVKTCEILDMPFFVSVCVKSTEDNTYYENDMAAAPGSHQINLKYDQMTRHLAVCRGFEITPRKFQEDLDETFEQYEMSDEEMPEEEI